MDTTSLIQAPARLARPRPTSREPPDGAKSKLKQQLFCPVDNVVVDRSETARGYEYARDQYVQFTDEELKAMEAARTGMIEL